MEFEWDENKRLANFAKHGIDFVEATGVFYDKNRLDFVDNRKDYGEERITTVGRMDDKIIVSVISTDRKYKTRIISARQASKKERRLYYGNR